MTENTLTSSGITLGYVRNIVIGAMGVGVFTAMVLFIVLYVVIAAPPV